MQQLPVLIPTLNVLDEQTFRRQLSEIESVAPIIQIDCADGIFTHWKNWYDPEIIAQIPTPSRYELHLMVQNPLKELARWYHVNNIARVILHVETISESLLAAYHAALELGDFEVGFAINPDTDRSILEPIISHLGHLMFLGVTPGKSGQKFQTKILSDLEKISEMHDHVLLEVDGGITTENIAMIKAHGAQIFCTGSAIFGNKQDPKQNYMHLMNLLDN